MELHLELLTSNCKILMDTTITISYIGEPVDITAKLREAFLFEVLNSFGIFLITFAILKRHGGKDGVRSAECGVRSAEYGVRSAESVSVKVFL